MERVRGRGGEHRQADGRGGRGAGEGRGRSPDRRVFRRRVRQLAAFRGRTEPHIREALRLSPHDTFAYGWLGTLGMANFNLGKDEEAIVWLRRSIEPIPISPSRIPSAAALAHLGRMEDARAAVEAGLTFDPSFTIGRRRANPFSTSPAYLKQIERYYAGLRMAGAPEG